MLQCRMVASGQPLSSRTPSASVISPSVLMPVESSTGVYVVEPRVVEEMPNGKFIGFPDVIDRYRAAGEKVGVYPINESSWMDMGQMEELEKMRRRLEEQS